MSNRSTRQGPPAAPKATSAKLTSPTSTPGVVTSGKPAFHGQDLIGKAPVPPANGTILNPYDVAQTYIGTPAKKP